MIVIAPGALEDLDRVFEFNLQRDPGSALEHLERIRSAVMMLEEHPELGRRIPRSTLRELVISHGRSGYLAGYEYSPVEGIIRVVAVRHQSERRYRSR